MTRRTRHLIWAFAGIVVFSAIAILVKSGMTTAVDDAGLRWMTTIRGPMATRVALFITRIGSGVILIPVGVMTTAWLLRLGRKPDGWLYLGTTLAGWAIYGILKAAFARPRPSLIPRLSQAGWWSFPSGHSMASMVVLGLAAILLTRSRLARLATLGLILAIVFSRVYLGVHYPSDVVAGLAAGAACISVALAVREVEPILLEHQLKEEIAQHHQGPGAGTAPADRTTGAGGGP